MSEQPEIRTREKVHNIKSLNRASVLSQRLKTCFIRSKQNAENVGETKQATPNDYAEEKLRSSGEKTAFDIGRVIEYSSKKSVKAVKNTEACNKTANKVGTMAKKTENAAAKAARAAVTKAKALISAIAAGGSTAGVVIIVICLIGLLAGSCFGIFFSGEDTGNGMSMQKAISEINSDYQAKLDEIKYSTPHDRMELSNGHPDWPEVLSVYAIKTGADSDVVTVTDEKKAQLKEIFWTMNEISPRSERKSVSVITESDDGNGNIVETESTQTLTFLYVTVTHKTAAEMASQYGFTDVQKNRMAELLSDENSSLWSSVLYGIGNGDDEIVKVALTQIGNSGGRPYWSWYGFNSRVEWCACFVSWCANESGYIDTGVIPRFASCSLGVQWFKEHDQWQSSTYTPKIGDIIFFDWDHDGGPDHVGIVESVSDGYVHTVEGNSGDACRQRAYSINCPDIFGYGIPAY